MKQLVWVTLLTVAVTFGLASTALAQPSVTTDQSDYPPGSTVNITGTGFQPGEIVQCQVLRVDIDENAGLEHYPWPVTADENGNFQTTWYVTPDEAGATLQLTATGETSGLVAQMTFTDSATVTAATGGSAISADTVGGTYTTLTGPVLAEGAHLDISTTGTIVLNAPSGFQFNTAATVTATVASAGGNNGSVLTLSSGTATVTASTITITVSAVDTGSNRRSSITWSGIQVRPTAGTPLASGNITESGTATIASINGSTIFGTLTEVVGAASKLVMNTEPSSSVTAGAAFSTQPAVYVEDAYGNVVTGNSSTVTATVQAGTGPLTGTTTATASSGVATFS